MKAKLIILMALTLMLGSIYVRADLLDKIASEEQTNQPSSPVRAQTNSAITFVVQVPSFTIAFPNTMTPSQINDVLRACFGTNLTLTFFATNSQTHERILFSGNSMPNSNELDQLFAWQRQHDSAITTQTSDSDLNSNIEERKAAALDRQADALERQAIALEAQTLAQERAADAAEDRAFQAQMMDDDIDFRLDMLQIQNSDPSLISPTLPIIPFAPIQQPAQPTFILVPGQVGPIIVPPKTPGQPQLITAPGLNGPVIVSP